MSIYGAFNKVKTLEQLKFFVENNDFDSLNETCEEIKKEYKIEDSNAERDIYGNLNQSGRKLAEKFMLKGIISKPYWYPIKNIQVERSDVFQVAELFIYEYITIKNSDAEEYGLLFSMSYITKIRNSYTQSKRAKERNITNENEVAIILLGKYIANNINNLDFRIEAKLESTYILSEIKMLDRTIEEKIESAKIRIDEIEPKIDEMGPKIDEMGPTLQITKGKVENINDNMITIMALFLSAFSIIGINIYSLQASISIREIILVNSSLVFVLAFLMNLLDLILNKEMYIYPEEKYIKNIKKHRNKMRRLMLLSAVVLGGVLLWTYFISYH